MASEAYNPVPQIAPDVRQPDDYQRVQSSPADFGGAIAQGAEKAGQGAFDLSKFWGQVQSTDASNKAQEEGLALAQHVSTLQGQDRLDAQASVAQQMEDIRLKHKNELSTPEAQLQYERQTTPYFNHFLGGKFKTAYLGAGKEVADGIADATYKGAHNMAAVAGADGDWGHVLVAENKALGSRIALATHNGMERDPATIQKAKQDAGYVWKSAIEAYAVEHPQQALDTLNDPKFKLQEKLGDEYPLLKERIQAQASKHFGSAVGAPEINKEIGAPGAFVPRSSAPLVPGTVRNAADVPSNLIGAAAPSSGGGTVATPSTAEQGRLTAAAAAAPQYHQATGPSFAPGTFDSAVGRTLHEEGGYNPSDANKVPVNFGINQAAHPEVDVSKLTRAQATQIYKRDYWDKIGGDQLSKTNPALAHVAFDAAVISGPDRAKEWITQSGGDASKFMDLRDAYLAKLATDDPARYAKYAHTWQQRDNNLRADIGLAPKGGVTLVGGVPVGIGSVSSAGGLASTSLANDNTAAPETAAATPTAVTTGEPPLPPAATPPGQPSETTQVDLDAWLAHAAARIQEKPWTDDQKEATLNKIKEQYVMAGLALGVNAKAKRDMSDAATEDVLGLVRKGDVQGAFQKLNAYDDRILSAKEKDTLEDIIRKQTGDDNPVHFGNGYFDALKRIQLPPDDPRRISSYADILKMMGPEVPVGSRLTTSGAKQIYESMTNSRKDYSASGMETERLHALEMLSHRLVGGTNYKGEPKNAKGNDIFLGPGTLAINNQFNAYSELRKQGKATEGFPLLADPKKMDALAETLYSRQQREYDIVHDTQPGEEVPEAPGTPLPSVPEGFGKLNEAGWGNLMTGIKGNHYIWADKIQNLLEDPNRLAPVWDERRKGTGAPSAEQIFKQIGFTPPSPVRGGPEVRKPETTGTFTPTPPIPAGRAAGVRQPPAPPGPAQTATTLSDYIPKLGLGPAASKAHLALWNAGYRGKDLEDELAREMERYGHEPNAAPTHVGRK